MCSYRRKGEGTVFLSSVKDNQSVDEKSLGFAHRVALGVLIYHANCRCLFRYNAVHASHRHHDSVEEDCFRGHRSSKLLQALRPFLVHATPLLRARRAGEVAAAWGDVRPPLPRGRRPAPPSLTLASPTTTATPTCTRSGTMTLLTMKPRRRRSRRPSITTWATATSTSRSQWSSSRRW